MRMAKQPNSLFAIALIVGLILGTNTAPVSAAEKITLVMTADQVGGYSRTLFKHWIDADKDGCNTRYEVLIAEAIVKPKVGAGCYLTGGKWKSSYEGKVFTNPTGLDIDHMVPLAEAWMEHAGQKDDSFASKYLKPAVASVQTLSGNAVAGMGNMFAGTAATA